MDHTLPLPSGTVTFLFTDIEGSTRLWEQHPEPMRAALARHDVLAEALIDQHAGTLVKSRGEGDSLFAVFARPTDALAAAGALQQALVAEPWPVETPLRVRLALHTGEADQRGGDFYGAAVNRCARLRAVGHGGQVLLSQATADPVREHLPAGTSLRDLGSHRLKDLQQPERIFQLLHPALPADFPPLRSLEAFAHNLPRQLTTFIGREPQMAEVKQLLATTSLLTLTGSGGCGKTRLALQVAAELLEEYADGVWLVELAALADPALLPQTVAAALGLREEPNRPLTATLVDYLRPKSLLLVLDNCEHLLTACAQLADTLLRAAPHLRVLASSREGLGIAGELTYRVPSLSLPDPRSLPPVERLAEYEAVSLFLDRARFSRPGFSLTPQNAAAVAQICQRLDGIPLAIELAAARVRALPVEQIAARLDDRFRLLTGGSRTALPRQQTLRALIDWSYNLLSEGEQTLLRRLSVFSGGWTLGGAEAVGAGAVVAAWEVLDLLTSLVDKSLVAYDEQGGEGRYRLLETVRQYARDRLLEAGEAAAVRTRHLEFFLNWAEQGPGHERLEAEHDNLRAALGWSGAQGQGEAGLRLGGALWGFWEMRGYWREAREYVAGLLALPGAEARTAARALALQRGGWLAWRQGDYGTARALLEESLAISREHGDKRDIAKSLTGLGNVAHDQGDYGTAQALLEESLTIFREIGDKWSIARSLASLGRVAGDQGDYGTARALIEESLAIFRESGDKAGISWSLLGLGSVALSQGDSGAARVLLEESLAIFRERGHKLGIAWSLTILGNVARNEGDAGAARALFEESLAIFREVWDKQGIAKSLCGLGIVVRDQGDLGAARVLIEESLVIFRELGDKEGIAYNLEGLAAVAVAQAQSERAACLFGAAEALREAMGAPLPPAHRAAHDRSVAAVRAALREEAFTAAWAAGRAMPLAQAIEYALQESSADTLTP
jgi:predicted ATPase/class 3 adenylate cyclase